MHANGSACLRGMHVTSTTTLLSSFLPTAANGFDAFSCFMSDWATGTASPMPTTNTANLSFFSCAPADASARNASGRNAVGLTMRFTSFSECEQVYLK
jgi:hypothetical protein